MPQGKVPVLQRLPEVRFESMELTDTKMYLKCVTPQLRLEMAPGDVVQAGVVMDAPARLAFLARHGRALRRKASPAACTPRAGRAPAGPRAAGAAAPRFRGAGR